VDVFIIVGY